MKNKKEIIIFIIIIEIIIILYLYSNFTHTENVINIVRDTHKIDNLSIKNNYEKFYINSKDSFEIVNYSFTDKITYSTNSDGLRDRFNYTKEKPNNTFRIAVFGDSYVYGFFVNIENVFTEVLEDRLNSLGCSNNFEVINFGVPGYEVSYMVELYEQKGKHYNSDVNIFFIKDDDIDVVNELFLPIREEYMSNEGWPDTNKENEFQKNIEVSHNIVEEYFRIKNKMNQTFLLNKYVRKPLESIHNNNTSITILSTFYMLEIHNNLIKIISEENEYNFAKLEPKHSQSNIWNQKIVVSPTIWNQKFVILPNQDQHPNKKGHELLSDTYFIYLINNNLIECNI